jgi:hypothetical protein
MRRRLLLPKMLAVTMVACAPSPSGTPQTVDAGTDGGLACQTTTYPNANTTCPCGCAEGCPSLDCLRVQPSADLCECVI